VGEQTVESDGDPKTGDHVHCQEEASVQQAEPGTPQRPHGSYETHEWEQGHEKNKAALKTSSFRFEQLDTGDHRLIAGYLGPFF
jgi:hypothetical protein